MSLVDQDPKLRRQVEDLRFIVEKLHRDGFPSVPISPLDQVILHERARCLVEMLDGKRCCT